jgi:hypothetical protein
MIRDSSPGRGWEIFLSPPRPDRLWSPPTCYSLGTRDSFPEGKVAGAWTWPLTSIWCRGQECVELYFRSPRKPSRCGAQLKDMDNFNFTLPLRCVCVCVCVYIKVIFKYLLWDLLEYCCGHSKDYLLKDKLNNLPKDCLKKSLNILLAEWLSTEKLK